MKPEEKNRKNARAVIDHLSQALVLAKSITGTSLEIDKLASEIEEKANEIELEVQSLKL